MSEKKVIELQIKSNLDNTNIGISKLKTNLKETSTEAKKTGQNVSEISKSNSSISSLGDSLGQLSPAFGNASKGANTLITKMWLIVTNPLGAILIAIVGAVTLLFKAFTSTKDGADKLSQVMAGLSATVDVVRDRILNVGNAIVKFFSGDFKGALDEGKKAVSGFGDEVATEFKKAADATKDLQQVEDAFNSLSVSRAKVNRDLAISKELLTDENASYAQKRKALDLIKTTEGKQTEQELANAKKKFEAIKALNALSDTSREDKKKEQDAEAALFALQEQSARDRRAINKQEKTLLNQKLSDEKDAAEKRKTISDAAETRRKENYAKEKTALEESLKAEGLNYEQRRNLIKDNLKLTALDRKKLNDEINKEEKKSIDEHNKTIAELNKRYDEEKENRLADTAIKKEELDYKRKVSEIEKLAQTELEKQTLIEKLDVEHKERMAVAQMTDAEKKKADAKKAADEEIEIEKAKAEQKKAIQDASFALASGAVGFLKEIAGKNKAIQKASIIAENAIGIGKMIIANNAANIGALATPQAIATSGASAIPAIAMNNISTALGVATTIAATAKALSAVGGGSAGSASTGGGVRGGSAPQFNVVGNSGVNQLAQTLGGTSEQAPIQAYVVASNVTSAQSMNRNIVTNASLG